jgi:hypothetical protein
MFAPHPPSGHLLPEGEGFISEGLKPLSRRERGGGEGRARLRSSHELPLIRLRHLLPEGEGFISEGLKPLSRRERGGGEGRARRRSSHELPLIRLRHLLPEGEGFISEGLKPLSQRERGWGEGRTVRRSSRRSPLIRPPGTFSRREKGVILSRRNLQPLSLREKGSFPRGSSPSPNGRGVGVRGERCGGLRAVRPSSALRAPSPGGRRASNPPQTMDPA